jgi:hypothetical protein
VPNTWSRWTNRSASRFANGWIGNWNGPRLPCLALRLLPRHRRSRLPLLHRLPIRRANSRECFRPPRLRIPARSKAHRHKLDRHKLDRNLENSPRCLSAPVWTYRAVECNKHRLRRFHLRPWRNRSNLENSPDYSEVHSRPPPPLECLTCRRRLRRNTHQVNLLGCLAQERLAVREHRRMQRKQLRLR